ncbi:MAG: DEAD/DEAH box helicase [Phycisphaerales bacterium]
MATNDMTARYNPHPRTETAPVEAAADAEGFAHRAAKPGEKTFADLGLLPMLLETVKSQGYITPTPIQAATIPAGIAGKDVLGTAQTGTGKTAAFALPILHRLQQAPADKSHRGPVFPRALILSPTRELTSQIAESFATYGKGTTLRNTTVYGGVSQFHQVRALKAGVDILIATPGRLMDLMNQRLVNLSNVSIFVLDEADRMLDMGFIEPIRRIASALPPREKVNRQTMLFSATMPREIQGLAEALLKDPLRIAVSAANSTVDRIDQSLYVVPKEKKSALLEHLLQEGNIRRAVVFTRTKFGAGAWARSSRRPASRLRASTATRIRTPASAPSPVSRTLRHACWSPPTSRPAALTSTTSPTSSTSTSPSSQSRTCTASAAPAARAPRARRSPSRIRRSTACSGRSSGSPRPASARSRSCPTCASV